MAKVVQISTHRTRVLREIKECSRDLARVDYSTNLNELTQARKVSMSAVWACLEEGEIDESQLIIETDSVYAKLHSIVAGVFIIVDIRLDNKTKRLSVLWAEEVEEE